MSRGDPSTKLYEAALCELTEFLQRTPATARQVAEAFGCGRNTAGKRLGELRRRGLVQMMRVREGACGPKSVLYAIYYEEMRRA